ncbi:hypothetical protein A3731_12365 [Roseovarius sp. HI0049]|nr:hypothetical protein A3731_12365 [Roseovarius sp. HI0049]
MNDRSETDGLRVLPVIPLHAVLSDQQAGRSIRIFPGPTVDRAARGLLRFADIVDVSTEFQHKGICHE